MQLSKMKNRFLRQSCLDAWEDYERSLHRRSFLKWDYLILTASNEEQAGVYRQALDRRLEKGLLPAQTHYAVLPDPGGKRIGSGGATLRVLQYIARQQYSQMGCAASHPFEGLRILVIHSGGDSRRIPQYSALGKLFSPVPRELPDGRASTLFDEMIIGMSGVPSRIASGMLVLSGDVLLLFNPLQIDAQLQGAAAISTKAPVRIGCEHGVFLGDGQGHVRAFLHKQPEERLRLSGAVNADGNVDLDTGAVLFGPGLLDALYSLITTDGRPDEEKLAAFCNERVRVSFYGDFLYPLGSDATRQMYYREAAEGEMSEELVNCRAKIWEAIHPYEMKLISLSPAQFLHFGTTEELWWLMAQDIADYEFLDWKPRVNSFLEENPSDALAGIPHSQELAALPRDFDSAECHRMRHIPSPAGAGTDAAERKACAAWNSIAQPGANGPVHIAASAYLECAEVTGASDVGEGTILSHVRLHNRTVPDSVVLHALPLQDGMQVVRIYGTGDNPKAQLPGNVPFLGTSLEDLLQVNCLSSEELWPRITGRTADGSQPRSLWNANLYPVCETQEEALDAAEVLYRMAGGHASREEVLRWKESRRMSLCSSFRQADTRAILQWEDELKDRILAKRFISRLDHGDDYCRALKIFGAGGMPDSVFNLLLREAERAPFSRRIRIYYALGGYLKRTEGVRSGYTGKTLESACFQTIQDAVCDAAQRNLQGRTGQRIVRESVDIALPLRVNWGGGWTDTPPQCLERGGVVLNAAIKLSGRLPARASLRRLDEPQIRLESLDSGAATVITDISQIQSCSDPFDAFALHKAALIACGIIPREGSAPFQELLGRFGGGFCLSTQACGVPRGSGLGTSSILAGACVKGIFEFFGIDYADSDLYQTVLGMEQLMSTGGGWQDQVGGLAGGVKLITTEPGMDQTIHVEKLTVPAPAAAGLQERFALIYTGQRRLARNLLRDVVGGYIGGREDSVRALEEMKTVALQMKASLEAGDIDDFARLMNRHWTLSCQLDGGSTNTCIDQIFLVCRDLIDGRFICGAGGGGFLQVILKKGITKACLQERLHSVFQDSGVGVWDCELLL